MNIDYKYYETDKIMSKRVEAIYLNHQRHQFYSCFDADEAVDRRGPRGGKIRGPKRICAYCGYKKKGHAVKTEVL